METSELRYVIQSCFDTGSLTEIFQERLNGQDPYDAAVEAILSEDETGVELVNRLDEESKPQREKIQSMNPRELRSGLSIEFIEPGRRLGLILWALLRDNRLSARSMANKVAEAFEQSSGQSSSVPPQPQAPLEPQSPPPDLSKEENLSSDIPHEHVQVDTDDQQDNEERSNLDPANDEIDADENKDVDESEVDQLIADLAAEEIEELSLPDEETYSDDKSDDDIPVLDEDFAEDVVEDVDSLLSTLSETSPEEEDEEVNLDDLDDMEGVIDASLSEENEDEEVETDRDLDEFPDEVSDTLDPEILSLIEDYNNSNDEDEEDELDLQSLDELLSASDDNTKTQEDLEDVESYIIGDEEEIAEPLNEGAIMSEKQEETKQSVALGGVEISVSSLQKACERIFQEPVELVTDKNLLEQDKLVVVGKECGVRVLHGPRYEIMGAQKPEPIPNQSVHVSPESLQAALSEIYQEPIFLIPDTNLLEKGSVVFAGKETGLSMLKNDNLCIDLPKWVQQESLSKEPVESQQQSLPPEFTEMQQRLAALEDEIASLRSQGNVIPVEVEPTAAPEPEAVVVEPEEQAVEEAQPEIAPELVTEEPAVDETEPPKIQPEETTENIDVPGTEEDEAVDGDLEIDLPEIDETDTLEEITDEQIEETPPTFDEISGESPESVEEDVENINTEEAVEDVELPDDLIHETPEVESTEEPSTEESSEEELNLDDIDLDDIDLDEALQEDDEEAVDLDVVEDDTSAEAETEIAPDEEDFNLDDLDLEALDEIDEESASGAHQVLNGEKVLLLGGDKKHQNDYKRIVDEIGGVSAWHEALNELSESEINQMVEESDIIMTLSSDALSDPGILQATNFAQENNKRHFQHHSASPASVQKQLVKLVEEGQI